MDDWVEDVEKIEQLLFEDMVPGFDVEQRVSLALLLTGDRPGASLKFMDDEKKKHVEEFIELTEFESLKFETGMHHKYYIARDINRFQLLEKVEEDSPYHTVKSEGLFLGYPRSAVDFYLNNRRKASKIFKAKVSDMIKKNLVEEKDLAYLDLVSYIPEASGSGILEAIDHGKIHKEKLEELDEEKNCDIGSKIIEEVFERSTPFCLR